MVEYLLSVYLVRCDVIFVAIIVFTITITKTLFIIPIIVDNELFYNLIC